MEATYSPRAAAAYQRAFAATGDAEYAAWTAQSIDSTDDTPAHVENARIARAEARS